MNGTPSARAASAPTSPGTAAEPRHDATMADTSAWSRGASSIRGETRRAWRARASSNPEGRASSRTVTTHRTRSAATLSARYSTIVTVSGSAQ
jgi:hypothetical protein